MKEKVETYATKIKKWGNSLAVRVPKSMATRLDLSENAPVELEAGNGELKIKSRKPKKYSLEEMLSGITSENIHNELKTGKAVGKEVW